MAKAEPEGGGGCSGGQHEVAVTGKLWGQLEIDREETLGDDGLQDLNRSHKQNYKLIEHSSQHY